MRKPRDFEAELKALEDKARELKTRKVQQNGRLGPSAARRGFGGKARRSAAANDDDAGSATPQPGSAQSPSGTTGTA